MATTAGLPPYMHPGVPVEQPPHLEGEASLATEILPGPPPISSVQQAAQKRDPRKPSAVFSYLPPADPGSTYSGIMHGTLIGQETQDGPRTKRSRVDKGTASGRAQRASARNQNGGTATMPLETTAPADTLVQLNSNSSPLEVEGFSVIDDEPSLSRSTSSHNLLEPPPPAPMGRMRRKDKGKGKEMDLDFVRVKEEPNHAVLPPPDAHASNLLNNEDHCSSCRSNGALIYCDGCPRAFHLWCLDPPMDSIDESDSRWFCPACMIRKQPPKKPPPSLLSPLIHQLNMSYPVEFQLPDDIRTHFKDVATGPKGNYVDTNEVKPLRINRLGQIEDRDPYRLKDRNGAPVLCFKCGLSTLPRGVPTDTIDDKRAHSLAIPKPDSTENWKNIISCDFCPLHWHLDCLDPPLPSMPAFNKKWMCPNHAERVLPLRRRVPKNSTPIEVTKHGQFNNGNVEIIPAHTTATSQPPRHVAADELLINGRRYRIPERVIVLDFWSKLNRATSHQEEEKEITSGLSSPLTSLSSLDDFGDDCSGEDMDMDEEFDDLKAAQTLCGLKSSGASGFPSRKTVDRGVQTALSDIDASVRTKSSRTFDTILPTKRTLTRAGTANGVAHPRQASSLTGSVSVSLSSGAARRKRSTQSIQPEPSNRELRSKTKTAMPNSSLTSVSSKDSMKPSDDDQNGKSLQDNPTITVIHGAKKAIHVKVEEAEDPFTLVNGVNAEVGPSTTPLTKTPRKRRGRRTFKELEGTKQAPSQKRGRKRKEREDDNQDFPGTATSVYTIKERKLDHEGKGEKRLTRRHSIRTPSQSGIAAPTPSSVVTNNTPSIPTTPSLKIRLPRLSNVSAAHNTSIPISTGSPSKV